MVIKRDALGNLIMNLSQLFDLDDEALVFATHQTVFMKDPSETDLSLGLYLLRRGVQKPEFLYLVTNGMDLQLLDERLPGAKRLTRNFRFRNVPFFGVIFKIYYNIRYNNKASRVERVVENISYRTVQLAEVSASQMTAINLLTDVTSKSLDSTNGILTSLREIESNTARMQALIYRSDLISQQVRSAEMKIEALQSVLDELCKGEGGNATPSVAAESGVNSQGGAVSISEIPKVTSQLRLNDLNNRSILEILKRAFK